MTRLTRAQVIELIGEIDDERMAELMSVGASAEELGEAVSEVTAEIQLGEEVSPPSTPRVAALRDLLVDVLIEVNDQERR